MTKKQTSTPGADADRPDKAQPEVRAKKRKPLILRFVKWLFVAAFAVLLLLVLLITGVVWTLTPDRLTPLVNRYASEYLMADVDAKRVELSFWSTFPKFSVEVDSLQVVSRAFNTLPDSVRRTLPADADSLLFMRRFSGGINLLKLFEGNIGIYDVDVIDTRANLLTVNDSVANYLIVPPSPPEPEKEKPMLMPDVSINRFTIAEGFSVKYRVPADTVDCNVTLKNLNLIDSINGEPLYALSFDGDAAAKVPLVEIAETPFFANGRIDWKSSEPLAVGLKDFTIGVGAVALEFTTVVDMTDTLKVKEFKAHLPRVEVMKALDVVPAAFRQPLKGLVTDMNVELSAKALGPFRPLENELPVIDAEFKAEASKVAFDRLNLNKLVIDVAARVDCSYPDATEIIVREIAAAGKAMDFSLDGTVKRPLTDPLIDARFKGSLTIQNLPSQLLSALPFAVRGVIHGQANIDTRLSYLNPKLFYKAKIDGEITLNDFRMAMTDGSFESYLRHGAFKFGSSSDITVKEHVIDSMLTASLRVDTMALLSPGVSLSGADIMAGVGARNLATSSDTTQINPIGATIKAGRMALRSDSDSLRVRLRDTRISASLMRYKGETRSPQVTAVLNSAAMRYADRFNRAGIRDAEMRLSFHPRPRPEMSPARKARFDSLAALYPTLSSDSIMRMMVQQYRLKHKHSLEDEGRENIKVELDNSIYTLLRRWQAGGDFKAKAIRLFTPYFPARNSLRDVDLSFSTDSVVLRNTRLKLGKSDFLLNGSVRNITRALLSRRGAPFELDFSVESDTIDVNNLTATMIRGAAFADKIAKGTRKGLADTESDEVLQRQIDSELPDTVRAAVIIPSNISGEFSLKARHVLYADLWLHGLDGLVEVFDGAVNLDRLRASTAIGAVNFTALYSAPTIYDLSFAAAVRLHRLNLRSVLDMMPGIDSLLPLLGEVKGIVDADVALTTRLDSMMNFDLQSLNLALNISGDSLQLLDNETFRTISKWMLFKHKERNMIDHMDVEVAVHDGYVDLYPFIFDMDRYRIGVRGSNDADLNLNYHVAVIKSPIPFKFGINIKGTPDKMKIKLGKARINEKTVAESRRITDTVRVNLVTEISDVFRRGVKATGSRGLQLKDSRPAGSASGSATSEDGTDSFSHADSVTLIQQGLIEKPAGFIMPGDTIKTEPQPKKSTKKKK